MSFYRFARMEAEKTSHLYIEGLMEASRPWWDEEGNYAVPSEFRAGMEAAGDGRLVVHLNSPGGDITAGMAIFEMLRQRKGETDCEVTFAASAASLIPCGVKKPRCLISPAGMVMIHNPSMAAYGDEGEMERAGAALKAWKKAAIGAYRERIDRSEEEIDRMMSGEMFLPARDAVEIGLCDGILPAAEEKGAGMYYRQAVMAAEQDSLKRMAMKQLAQDEAEERRALMEFART